MKRYATSITEREIIPLLEKLKQWSNKFHTTTYKVGYFTRTSTKNVTFFIKTSYPERIDGYLLTGLIRRMSELNLHLEHISHDEVYLEEDEHKLSESYILEFVGSSLGKQYNPLYTISNNITGHRFFPPHITKEVN